MLVTSIHTWQEFTFASFAIMDDLDKGNFEGRSNSLTNVEPTDLTDQEDSDRKCLIS